MPGAQGCRWREGLMVYGKAYIHREDALRTWASQKTRSSRSPRDAQPGLRVARSPRLTCHSVAAAFRAMQQPTPTSRTGTTTSSPATMKSWGSNDLPLFPVRAVGSLDQPG
jgi:hypothetical protein